MNAQPWWSTPLFTVLGVFLTQAGNILANHLRQRAERGDRWDKDKIAIYQAFQRACTALLRTPVWPSEPAGPQAPVRPSFETLLQLGDDISGLSRAKVTQAANAAAAAAHRLVEVVEEIRRTGQRGIGGAVEEKEQPRLSAARTSLGAAIDDFAATWRRELGITAPYSASLRPEDRPF